MFAVRLTDACWEREIEFYGPYDFNQAFKVQTELNELIMKSGVDFYAELVKCVEFDKETAAQIFERALDD